MKLKMNFIMWKVFNNVLHNTFGMKLLHIGVMKCFITRFIT